MTPVLRRAGGLLTVVAALSVVGMAPSVADDEDPRPTQWPTVRAPSEGGAGQSDPQPTAPPTVKKPDSPGDEDPAPTEWPAPAQN